MLTQSELRSLWHQLRETHTLSVYFPDHEGQPTMSEGAPRPLMHALADTRDLLRGTSPAEYKAFDHAVQHLEAHLAGLAGAGSCSGLVAFVTADGVASAFRYCGTHSPLISWQRGMVVAPYLPLLDRLPEAAIAIVDSRHAWMYHYGRGVLTAGARLHAAERWDPEEHMGAPPRMGYHFGTRGTTATDAAHRAREVRRSRIARLAAEQLVALADHDGVIIIGGISTTAVATLAQLPSAHRARAHVLPGLDVRASAATIRRRVGDAIRGWQQQADVERLEEVLSEAYPSGPARSGADAALAALQTNGAGAVWITEGCILRDLELAEAAVQLALVSHADVTCVDGDAGALLDARGGIAVSLRFDVPNLSAPIVSASA